MSALEELVYYCKEENSFGALMLTGRWGCGKTFLIEHDLTSTLGDQFIIIRVSLFGIASIEDINLKIKKLFFEKIALNADEYFNAGAKDAQRAGKWLAKNIGTVAKSAQEHSGIALIRDFVKLLPAGEQILSINPSDYINIENKIGRKTVVLVFDDLERNTLDETKILGCINEYCENKQFKTIIVANEEKMSTSANAAVLDGAPKNNGASKGEDNLAYAQIKEKIVSRTIKCTPDYDKIIGEILNRFIGDSGYKDFLLKHAENVIGVFMAGKSENIRSLKCAIQDFQRVYLLLSHFGVADHLEKYLCSFITYSLYFKEGKFEKSDLYGYLFLDSNIEKIYPLHYKNGYMLDSVKSWITEGEWMQAAVEADIAQKIAAPKAPNPEDLVKSYPLLSLDESVIANGFASVIKAGYAGELSIDQYILLLENISWARSVSFELPTAIEIDDIKAGVEIRLHLIEESDEPLVRYGGMLSDEKKALLSEPEKEIYRVVQDFRENNIQMFAVNRRKYISALSKADMSDLYGCENKRFNLFDDTMANTVSNFFVHLSNFDRQYFISLFRKMWLNSCSSPDLQKEKSLDGFKILKDKLKENQEIELRDKQQLKAALSKMFIHAVTETIENVNTLISSGSQE